ncbi:hypothetical protein ACJX0J_009074 [Zea mays]
MIRRFLQIESMFSYNDNLIRFPHFWSKKISQLIGFLTITLYLFMYYTFLLCLFRIFGVGGVGQPTPGLIMYSIIHLITTIWFLCMDCNCNTAAAVSQTSLPYIHVTRGVHIILQHKHLQHEQGPTNVIFASESLFINSVIRNKHQTCIYFQGTTTFNLLQGGVDTKAASWRRTFEMLHSRKPRMSSSHSKFDLGVITPKPRTA